MSPILSNIYLDRLDSYVEDTLIPEYTRGGLRGRNREYYRLLFRGSHHKKQGEIEKWKEIRKEMQLLPSGDPNDPKYRRLKYVRYADDWLLGFIGPKTEAEEIKGKIATFLGTELKLTLSAEKTLITHAQTGRARFLGYEIGMLESATKFDRLRRRIVNGRVAMYIPEDVIQAKRKRYMRGETIMHRPELLNESEFEIITLYQGEYRGLVNYYGMAYNLAFLGYLGWTMETSLLKTLASKNQTTVAKERKRLKATIKTPAGPRLCLKLTVQREKKKPIVATFGGLSLRRLKKPVIKDQVLKRYVNTRSEIIERISHDTCEVCGAQGRVEMHHVRKLRDLNKQGKREIPLWMKVMISRKRKSIPLCKRCHDDIHHNRPKSQRQGNRRAG